MHNSYFGECNSSNLDKTVTDVVKLLEQLDMCISVAESCTGGLLSQLITSVSGASSVYELGVCSYSERIKSEILSVPEELIDEFGVVSEEVALSMVQGIKKLSCADVCVSVTGIAGPGGGTEKTPVGTVFIGFSILGRECVKAPEFYEMPNLTRDKVRYSTAEYVFAFLKEQLELLRK